jgi:hypothetical protein
VNRIEWSFLPERLGTEHEAEDTHTEEIIRILRQTESGRNVEGVPSSPRAKLRSVLLPPRLCLREILILVLLPKPDDVEQLMEPSLGELYFCDIAILVEGSEDAAHFSALTDQLGWCRKFGCHFVVCRGKTKLIAVDLARRRNAGGFRLRASPVFRSILSTTLGIAEKPTSAA